MLQRELTFYCRRQLSLPEARQLKRLAGLFKSKLLLLNLSRHLQADPEQPFALLTTACHAGDLCQLVVEGPDAELAHMVFTSWATEQGLPLGGRRPDFQPAQARLAARLPAYHCTSAMLAECNELPDKLHCLRQLVDLLPSPQVLDSALLTRQLQAREAISATGVCPGLALPHVLSPAMLAPCLTLLYSHSPLAWGSTLGPARLLILVAAPQDLSPDLLRPIPTLVRNLMDPLLSGALLRASSQCARHAILIEALLPPAGSWRGTGSASAPSSA